ncbi:hypothetical protein CFP65_6352 [Kitasatospora sp. MMS16-BH015]|uniref:hypothetical protein n=1 Tax=Kitasatospora sp. MMS16-BH015 TaxID=2018025 RepID=UPI000CA1A84A|nr:hypothetical protein [Kitasatospora sp. MMS16-BH015]AUG81010.1 hypothetical protein CFP65_6352 [Kitasatospora sp. MMS16-BH015]
MLFEAYEPWAGRARLRARWVVAVAGVSWLPLLGVPLAAGPTGVRIVCGVLIGLTLLPLVTRERPAFRRICWTVSGLMFGALLITGPYVILLWPAFAVVCPAGVLLLVAAKREVGRVALAVAGGYACVPLVLSLATDYHFGWGLVG